MLMRTSNPRKLLACELKTIGFEPDKIFALMPAWCLEVIDQPSGLHEVRGLAAKYLGLEVGPDGKLRKRLMSHASFKSKPGTQAAALDPLRALIAALASEIASVTRNPYTGSDLNATSLRSRLLENPGLQWLGLRELLAVCWGNGVPVVYLPHLPISKSNIDGIVTMSEGRPVIIITKDAEPAWLLYVLAHEMGHIFLRHLESEGGSIFDENVSVDANYEITSEVDKQEFETNRYTSYLLRGSIEFSMSIPKKAPEFARTAEHIGRNLRIDPGHIILNATKHSRSFGRTPWHLAKSALALLSEKPSADIFHHMLREHIDMGRLSDNACELYRRMGLIQQTW
jgi:hypothetical protein